MAQEKSVIKAIVDKVESMNRLDIRTLSLDATV